MHGGPPLNTAINKLAALLRKMSINTYQARLGCKIMSQDESIYSQTQANLDAK